MMHFAEVTEQEIEALLYGLGSDAEELPASLDEFVQVDEGRWVSLSALLHSSAPIYC